MPRVKGKSRQQVLQFQKGFTRATFGWTIMLIVVCLIVAAVMGNLEWRAFNEWRLQRDWNIIPTGIITFFNWWVIATFIALAIPIVATITYAVLQGRNDDAIFFGFVGLLILPLFGFVEDLFAHVIPLVNNADWVEWLFVTRIQWLPGLYVSGWVILFIVIIVAIMGWLLAMTMLRRRKVRIQM